MRRLIFILFLLLLLVGLSHLLWAQDLSGSWTGAVDVAGQNLPFTVHLEKDAEGQWSGKIDIQGATGLTLQNVSAEPSKVHFELQAGPGVAVWEGALKGEAVEGTFGQSGIEGTFKMERSQEEPGEGEQEASQPAPYDEQDLTLEAGEVTLACTYTRPHGDGPFPAVHLISGSGPQGSACARASKKACKTIRS